VAGGARSILFINDMIEILMADQKDSDILQDYWRSVTW
jgi:hypothetical protein